MIEAFPLYWPEGVPRSNRPTRSAFKTGFGVARNELLGEVSRMGGTQVVLSANIPLGNDGLPRANCPEPSDRGVAIYFKRGGRDLVFACDKYDRTWDNIYALAKTINAMRGIERWGGKEVMERAFTGFKQLTSGENWWDVLQVSPTANDAEINAAFRRLALDAHPDRGGSEAQMSRLNVARNQAKGRLR